MRYLSTAALLAAILGAGAALAQTPPATGGGDAANGQTRATGGISQGGTGAESSGNTDNSMVGTTANGTRSGGGTAGKAKSTVSHNKGKTPSPGTGTSSQGTSK
jgi:hypothetical protein